LASNTSLHRLTTRCLRGLGHLVVGGAALLIASSASFWLWSFTLRSHVRLGMAYPVLWLLLLGLLGTLLLRLPMRWRLLLALGLMTATLIFAPQHHCGRGC
jgi:hypothetical protein